MTDDEWEYGGEAIRESILNAEEGEYLRIGIEGLEEPLVEGEVTAIFEEGEDQRVVYLHTGNALTVDGDEFYINATESDHDWV